MLSNLSRYAWESLKIFLQEAQPERNAIPGAVIAIQTFGDFLGFYPHCHILMTLRPWKTWPVISFGRPSPKSGCSTWIRKAAMTLSSAFSNHWGMRPFARAGAPDLKDMLAFNAYSSALKDVSYC